MVEGWPLGAVVPAEIVVNGERFPLRLVVEDRGAARPSATAAPAPAALPAPPAVGGGVPIVPPMPGRVVELRVAEGDRVQKGQVILVLEAMKMRNEIASPVVGTVRRLSVVAGASVRAREPMLVIEPG